MSFITFGQIDKKLLLIFVITVVRTINLVISNEVPEDYSNSILCSLEEEIGPIIAGIILKLLSKPKKEKSTENKKSFKYIVFLFLVRAAKSCYERIYPYINKNKYYKYNAILNTVNGVEIFLMTLGTFLLLKYKYYIHHFVSMVIFCVLGITNDFILENYFIIRYNYIYIYIVYILNEVLVFCYLKYMLDKLYYQFIEIILYWGITGTLVKLIIFSGMSIHEYNNDIEGIIDGLHKYFTETNVLIIIFYQFFYYLLDGAIYLVLIVLLLYYLRPNHMIITDEIHVYIGLIFYKDKPNKYYTLIPFVFQMLALMFYFEILEFNFCNLNLNTAKNIHMRGDMEDLSDCSRKSIVSTIELGDQYYLKNNETKNEGEFLYDDNDMINNVQTINDS